VQKKLALHSNRWLLWAIPILCNHRCSVRECIAHTILARKRQSH